MVLGALFLAWWVQKPAAKKHTVVTRGLAFSTVYQISLVVEKSPKTVEEKVRSIVTEETEFVERTMSRYREDSELSEINRTDAGVPFEVSGPLGELLSEALAVSRLTDGAFDITVGPLLALWGFGQKRGRTELPSDKDVVSALARTGADNLVLDPSTATVTKKIPGLDLDLSAIAKGYAVDRISDALAAAGFRHYLVEIGGEVRANGRNSRDVPWRVGIEKPISESRQTFQVIELDNRSVATSGDYRNFFTLDGRRFSHTIDPRNGRPVSHGLASVTVVHAKCAMADALATGLTVLGPDKGYQLAKSQRLPALFITRKKNGSLYDHAPPEFMALAASRKSSTVEPLEGEDL